MKNLFRGLIGGVALLAMAAAPSFAADLALDGNLRGLCSTATATSGAATLNNKCGIVTSEALTTGPGSDYTLTITNSVVAITDLILASVTYGTSTTGAPFVARITPQEGSAVILIRNGSVAANPVLNGTIKVTYFVIKP